MLPLLLACSAPAPTPGLWREAEPCGGVVPTWYLDQDGDGYGGGVALGACDAPAGYVATGGDCDDDDAAVHPGAIEVCNGLDDDCDGAFDPESIWSRWYYDDDEDGFGTDRFSVIACGQPNGWSATADDCDDTVATTHPGAEELCDEADNDCNGVVDDVAEPSTWYVDGDGDGFGTRAEVRVQCAQPDGFAPESGDCDDAQFTVRPESAEMCDGIDNNCDAVVDSDCGACTLSVPANAPTVADAMDLAQDGDVICVATGTWVGSVDFGGRAVTVTGLFAAEETILLGDSGPTVWFGSGEGPDAVLRGLTVSGGGAGGISIDGALPTVEDLIIEQNSAGSFGDGGGLVVVDSAPFLRGLRIRDNHADTSYCGGSYGYGGGVVLRDSDAVLENVVIEGNYAGEAGAGLYAWGGAPVLTNVVVRENWGHWPGGGGLMLRESDAVFDNVLIVENIATDPGLEARGGGVYVWGGSPRFTNVVIAGNSAQTAGGGLYVESGTPSLENVIVSTNTGEGIYIEVGSANLVWTDVWGNTAGDFVGMVDPTGTDGNLSVDPGFSDAWHLDATSALLDAGDPGLLDPDGSASDPGAFGGPGAATWDLDGDGFPAWWLPGPFDSATSPDQDCDDEDPSVFPGAGC